MTNATFSQAAHILRIVEEKGTPRSRLQFIIGAGLLADLLDSKVEEVNREEFRKLLGLRPLDEVCRRTPGSFFVNRSGLWVDPDFRSQVVSKVAMALNEPVAVQSTLLERDMFDTEIEEMLGDGHLFTEDQVCELLVEMISEQEGGEEGRLLNNGYTNLFYTGSCVVYVDWHAGGREWYVGTYDRDGGWIAGSRVFSPATGA